MTTNFQVASTVRKGTAHLPFAEALELAKAFCAVEPSGVLLYIESTETQWSQEARAGRAPGLVEP